ncbi:NADH-quinone oxidoreductase subunit J [Barrientosiimonas humi]|uniref:NADH-quinone oxidoreductase subunit J n=1 Tax=Barrientosiimonas humi TaxID=999931 RepID=A0A542X8B2_9MICO|nr:NADH-quinone oxidoreductase subunit J [Barrientosiimonas humi]TQL32072.1 NADH-quinone oxidoreductase subunit J [Barrientosiimonas humi]CAG7572034.1 NADH-quinone oxidoreductase subunit J [Barrientosiimonas humi]
MMALGGGEAALFWIAGPLSVFGALTLLFARKAVHAAMGMALTMVLMGVFYIAQQAEFLGVIQIFVYSGAVMMLFLFVIMLVGVDSSDSLVETIKGQRVAGLLLAGALAAMSLALIARTQFRPINASVDPNADGNVSGVSKLIFGPYVWAFEATSALLITAALGAMVLAHRERLRPKPTQADWARRRVQSGENVAGLPAPGVYARHNAVDTPALLPDGQPSELSISRVLRARGQVAPTGGYLEATEDADRETGQPDPDSDGTQTAVADTTPGGAR